ncbi:uncharacterized protein [Chironomus tepperi]|uniref:uncharacterized protein n=1 Tax=Chironomus tepperi TaxID=113505 RepID=UPI00391EE29C
MKLFAIIVSLMLVQALALPMEDPSKPEEMPKPKNDVVDQFRADIIEQFYRFQTFYDLFNERMTHYRLEHVNLVTEIGLDMMEVFSVDLDIIRQSKDYVDMQFRNALDRLGGNPNACLNEVQAALDANSARLGTEFNACARRANATISNGLAEIFYPTFDSIQNSASTVPLLTINALSRGNVFDDAQEILDYLDAQYQVITLQWKSAASQLFRWDTNRFRVEGRFYIEEMLLCLLEPVENYRNTNTFNMYRIVDECAPTRQ